MRRLSFSRTQELFKKSNSSIPDIDDDEFRYGKEQLFTNCTFLEDKKGNKFILSEKGNLFDFPHGIFVYWHDKGWGFIRKDTFLVYQKDNGFIEHHLPKGYSFIFKQYPFDSIYDTYSKIGDEWMYSFHSKATHFYESATRDKFRVDVQGWGDIAVIEKEGLKALFSIEKQKILVGKIDGAIYRDKECTYRSGRTPCDNEYRVYIAYFKNGKRHEWDI